MTVMAATFGALSEVQFMHAICPFEAQEVKQSNASNDAQFGIEMKELQPLQADYSKLKEEFLHSATKSPFYCKMISQPFCTVLCFPPEVSCHNGSRIPQVERQLHSVAKSAVCCEVISQPFLCLYEISQTSFALVK